MHAADAVVIVRRHFLQLREMAVATAADGIGEIPANSAGRIGEPIWKGSGFGVQEQARGFAGAGGHDDGAGVDAFFRARGFVNVGDAFGFAFFVDKNLASHRAGDQGQLAGFHRGREQHLAGAEV